MKCPVSRLKYAGVSVSDVETTEKVLGNGAFAKVVEGFVRESDLWSRTDVAVRRGSQPLSAERERRSLEHVELLMRCNHPSIVSIICFQVKPEAESILVTERCETDLDHILDTESRGKPTSWYHDGDRVEWNDTKKVIAAFGTAVGLLYLHYKGAIHRDVKPSNILVDKRMYPKLYGFHFSRMIPREGEEMEIGVGTPLYKAPELFEEEPGSQSADVYSYSLLVYELLTGKKPYYNKRELTSFALAKMVLAGKRPDIPDWIPEDWQYLIERCWEQKPGDRPTMKEVVETMLDGDLTISGNYDRNEFEDYTKMVIDALPRRLRESLFT